MRVGNAGLPLVLTCVFSQETEGKLLRLPAQCGDQGCLREQDSGLAVLLGGAGS